MSQDTYKFSTSGAGSSFEAFVAKGDRFNAVVVDRQKDFRSREDAVKWGRRRVRELTTGIVKQPKAPPASICRNCKFAHWQYTASGRPSNSVSGRCLWHLPAIKLPIAAVHLRKAIDQAGRWNAIWRRDVQPCDTFEPIP